MLLCVVVPKKVITAMSGSKTVRNSDGPVCYYPVFGPFKIGGRSETGPSLVRNVVDRNDDIMAPWLC